MDKEKFNLLKELTSEIGVTGGESSFIKKISDIFNSYKINFGIDNRNTIFIGNFKNPTIIIGSHYDEVGFEISKINNDGTLSFFPIGNIPLHHMIYQKVEIINSEGKKILGYVNDYSLFNLNRSKSITDLRIYIGASNEEEVIEKYKIKTGNIGSFKRDFEETEEFIITNSIDNRISLFISLYTYLNLPPQISSQIGIFFYSTEENGCYSEDYLANNFKSKFLIILDYCPADIEPRSSDKYVDEYPRLGLGPVVFWAGENYVLNEKIKKILEDLDLFFQKGLFFNLVSPESARFTRFHSFIDLTLLIPALGYHTSNYLILKKDMNLTINFLDKLIRKIVTL